MKQEKCRTILLELYVLKTVMGFRNYITEKYFFTKKRC